MSIFNTDECTPVSTSFNNIVVYWNAEFILLKEELPPLIQFK